MTNDVYSEWPPPHYYSPSEAELAEICEAVSEFDESEFRITSVGYISRGFPFEIDGEIVNRLPADYPRFWPIPRKVN